MGSTDFTKLQMDEGHENVSVTFLEYNPKEADI